MCVIRQTRPFVRSGVYVIRPSARSGTHEWFFVSGVDRSWRRAGMHDVRFTRAHLARATLLRHGGQKSGSSHLCRGGGCYHGFFGSHTLASTAGRRTRTAVLRDILGNLLL
ncbi:unnamed protein product [Ectocarpus sp. 12 AP-2014]